MDAKISEYMARIGRKGGQVVSKAKLAACRRNGRLNKKRKPVTV